MEPVHALPPLRSIMAEGPEFSRTIIEPLKRKGVDQFGDYGFQIRCKITTRPGGQFVIRRNAFPRIKQAFDENGIRFASPPVRVAGSLSDRTAQSPETDGHPTRPDEGPTVAMPMPFDVIPPRSLAPRRCFVGPGASSSGGRSGRCSHSEAVQGSPDARARPPRSRPPERLRSPPCLAIAPKH
jgi:hypothetical protein